MRTKKRDQSDAVTFHENTHNRIIVKKTKTNLILSQRQIESLLKNEYKLWPSSRYLSPQQQTHGDVAMHVLEDPTNQVFPAWHKQAQHKWALAQVRPRLSLHGNSGEPSLSHMLAIFVASSQRLCSNFVEPCSNFVKLVPTSSNSATTCSNFVKFVTTS